MQFNPNQLGHGGTPGGRPPGILAKAVAAVATVIIAIAAFMFSIVIFAVAITVGLLIWAYLWWKMRGLRKRMESEMRDFEGFTREGRSPGNSGEVIEGTVIREVDEDEPRRDNSTQANDDRRTP